ncbi:MAG: hypothetical protein ACJ8CZ_05340, partial [Microvirga sp.]
MSRSRFLTDELALSSPRRRACSFPAAALMAALGLATGGLVYLRIPVAPVGSEHAPAPARADVGAASPVDSAWLLDPTPSLGAETLKRWQAPLGSAFQLAATRPDTMMDPLISPQEQA